MQKETQGTWTGEERRYERYEGMMGDDTEGRAEGMLAGTKERAQETRDRVQEGVEGGKDKMAGGIEKGADMMREKLPHEGMVGKAGDRAADTLERTAGYLRDHETTELWTDVQEYVKEHPATALVGALAAGFVLSRILR